MTRYQRTLHSSVGCIDIFVYDTPGLNDTGLTAKQVCSMMVEETNGCIHVLVYCIDINGRFRKSDEKLLTNLTKSLGKGVYDHAVFALTKADRALHENPETDLDALRGEFRTSVHEALRGAGIPDETMEAIPFALTAAKDDHYVPPECQQGGENEIKNWFWMEQFLLYIMDRVNPRAAFALLELHESTLGKFVRNHPYITGVSTFAIGTAVLATGSVVGLVATFKFLAIDTGMTLAATAATAGSMGLGSKIGSMLHTVVSKKLSEWFKIKQE